MAFLPGEIIGAAFPRIARGDDDRRGQDRHFAFELIYDREKMIESKLKKVRRLAHDCGKTEIGRRGDHADQLWPCFFDRSARCHIPSDSANQERAMVAPFVACSRDDRN